jgi:hypothetical protein
VGEVGGGKEFVGFTDYLFYLSCVPWLQDLFVIGISPLLVLTCHLSSVFSKTTNARQINLQINKQVVVWFYYHIMGKKKTNPGIKKYSLSVLKMQDFVHLIFVSSNYINNWCPVFVRIEFIFFV